MDGTIATGRRAAIASIQSLTLALLAFAFWAQAASANAITDENARPGDPGWQAGVSTLVAPASEIEGYAGQASASPGDEVQFHVRAADRYRVVIYRLGWYGGVGGRRVACLPSCTSDRAPASQQAPPAPDPATGIVRAGWSATDTFRVPADARSGYYLAEFVLTAGSHAGRARPYPFIVRPDASSPPSLLVVAPVNTWQAYNNWGGKSLYGFNSTGSVAANHVSFDRPYASANGPVLEWEIQAVRYLERNGEDVGYVTDVDVDRQPGVLTEMPTGLAPQHGAVVILGHSEYWSKRIRDAYDAQVAGGRNLVALGADDGMWQVRYEDADRTLVEYRFAAADPSPDPATKTASFDSLNPPRPVCELLGVEFQGLEREGSPPGAYAVPPAAASDPWFTGTGLVAGDLLPDTVGTEWDSVVPGCNVPPLTGLFQFSGTLGGKPTRADAVRYQTPSGARVFSAGSLRFEWGLDDYPGPTRPSGETANVGLERFVENLLHDLVGAPSSPPPPPQQPPPPDIPFGGVDLLSKVVTAKHAAVRVSAWCPRTAIGRCTGTLVLGKRRSGRITVRFGRAALSLIPGVRSTIRVRLTRRARRTLAKHGQLRAWVVASAHDRRGLTQITLARLVIM
ncbi:MAG: hypothetical protein JOZ25_11980 [Actinobacteria bacterium]|nr:hypothetical protein [Actinomycetota bacterium]